VSREQRVGLLATRRTQLATQSNVGRQNDNRNRYTVRESRLAPNIGLEAIQDVARSGGNEDDI
jgi:hypothetical protein